MIEQAKKTCPLCRKARPSNWFRPNLHNESVEVCNSCVLLKRGLNGKRVRTSVQAIRTWQQVEFAVREIAESQAEIKFVEKDNEYLGELMAHITLFKNMVETFLESQKIKNIKRAFRFGTIEMKNSRFRIDVNPELAWEMRDKP